MTSGGAAALVLLCGDDETRETHPAEAPPVIRPNVVYTSAESCAVFTTSLPQGIAPAPPTRPVRYVVQQ